MTLSLTVRQQIGFQTINNEAKLKLLPSPWPLDALPPPSASLLSVASSKGIMAAAGPEVVVVVRTESVRKATCAIPKAVDSRDNIKPIDPDLTLPMARASHVVFSVDESVLVVSPQDSGGLIAYQVDGLLKGETQPALQVSTNNTGLRALIANPSPDSAELFAAVTTNGELLMADLRSGGLRNGTDGVILRTGVSCLSWSNKGKQLVAGLANGSAVQIKPDGTVTAEIPRPPTLAEDMHVSAMSWLSNTRQTTRAATAWHLPQIITLSPANQRRPTLHFRSCQRSYPHSAWTAYRLFSLLLGYGTSNLICRTSSWLLRQHLVTLGLSHEPMHLCRRTNRLSVTSR
jgi:hypothetical protein